MVMYSTIKKEFEQARLRIVGAARPPDIEVSS